MCHFPKDRNSPMSAPSPSLPTSSYLLFTSYPLKPYLLVIAVFSLLLEQTRYENFLNIFFPPAAGNNLPYGLTDILYTRPNLYTYSPL